MLLLEHCSSALVLQLNVNVTRLVLLVLLGLSSFQLLGHSVKLQWCQCNGSLLGLLGLQLSFHQSIGFIFLNVILEGCWAQLLPWHTVILGLILLGATSLIIILGGRDLLTEVAQVALLWPLVESGLLNLHTLLRPGLQTSGLQKIEQPLNVPPLELVGFELDL